VLAILAGIALVCWLIVKSTDALVDDLASGDPERVEHALDHW
jgi:hypothetical protein